ncbi:hypothetical protein G1H11_00225 [Phytoactinopolyspora alkaliphila]|uniref:TetR/AcrR family transcriptional regulator n=1 Tax=Phytoactinopolyspora alkaliphila TaxID=1783498 RepID=A0A6N9YFQ8_9ACTN|nr:hypothetical protein [Phytoactinopolyspora alkaliphila]NED93738.1 hypothetical protein [Phytoactinopolyspora alkaliphila]
MSDARVGSVLQHLRRPHTQRDDQETHMLLNLGVGLMLAPTSDVTTDLTQRVPQLRWPTRDELVRAYNHRTGLRRSKAIVEDRWVRMADYHRDLTAWVVARMRTSTHRQMHAVAGAAETPEPITTDNSYDLSRRALERLLTNEVFPLWAMLVSLAASDPALGPIIRQARTEETLRWAELANVHFETAGRSPLPGLTTIDIAESVNALSFGLALRYRTDPARFGHEPSRAAELFAQTCLAMVDALLTPATSAGETASEPTMTMGEVVTQMATVGVPRVRRHDDEALVS